MVLVAVSNNGMALQCVSDIYKTKNICLIAYKQNAACVGLIPEAFIEEIINDETEFDFDNDEEEE